MEITYHNKYLRGLSGKNYMVGSLLGEGYEGAIYEIVGNAFSAIKIFNPNHMLPDNASDKCIYLENKIKAMVDSPVNAQINGQKCFTWPEDVVYDGDKFVGYIMPIVRNMRNLNSVLGLNNRRKIFPNNTTLYSIAIALNLAYATEFAHMNGHCIGDLNPNSILVDERGSVTFIGTDSFEISDRRSSMVYKCLVGYSALVAPELQKKSFRNPDVHFTKESDCFSLAILIFMVLMNGIHPFYSMNADETVEEAIIKGHYKYGHSSRVGNDIPVNAASYKLLPDYISNLFEITFTYTARTAYSTVKKRPMAYEWYSALYRMFRENLPNTPGISGIPVNVRPSREQHIPTMSDIDLTILA